MPLIRPDDPLPPVWLVLGDGGPLVDDLVKSIVAAGLQRCGIPAFNHGSWRGSDPEAMAAVGTARTLPMMSDLRVVELRELEAATDAVLGAVTEYLESPSPTTLLILVGTGFPKVEKGGTNWGSKIQTLVKKHGRLDKLSASDVRPTRFVADRAAALGKRLGHREADALVALVGEDPYRLAQEVAKVALYVGDAAVITEDDVLAACSSLATSVIWDLTGGIAARDPDLALSALHRQLDAGEDPRRLLGMIAWQVRQLLVAAEMAVRGASDGDIAGATRLRSPVVAKLRSAVRAGRAPSTAGWTARLARANRDMNQHRAGDRRIIEALVLDLCDG